MLTAQSILPNQVRRIKTLQTRSGLKDDEYLSLLAAYTTSDGRIAQSCKDLTVRQADDFASKLQHLASGRPVSAPSITGNTKLRYEHLATRSAFWASPAQLRLIEAEWSQKSRMETQDEREAALQRFIEKRFKRSTMEMIERALVQKIIKAIRSMKKPASLTQQKI